MPSLETGPPSEGGPVLIRFDQHGDPLPAYKVRHRCADRRPAKFVRLPALVEGYSVCFATDPGYIPAGDAPVLRFGSETAVFVGEVGRGYAVQIIPSASGTFKFWIEDAGTARSAAGTVQIPPKLELHDRAHCTMAISPDSIVVQTLVSKWMGPLSAWRPHLVAASHAGYNMIHFTPLQRRGTSNSPYSIYDHHEIDPHLFPPHTEPHTRRDQLQLQIDAMDRELGLLSMIDVVWNHTACDSPWLAAQPDAGYNLQNSPHLKLAYELDEAILAFSAMLEHEGEHQVSADPRDEADVRVILDFFLGSMLPKLALWEFFVVNVAHALADLEGAFRKEAALRPAGGDDAAATTPHRLGDALYFDGSYARNAYRMNLRAVTQIYRSKISEYRGMRSERERGLLLARVLDDYKRELDEINSARYRVYDEKVAQITKNLHNRMVYERVAEHGPRIGPITASSPLVPTYFTRVRCADGTLLVFANNGWIWDADPLLNFADPHSDVYFTRDVIIWGDCVKLRYGAAPADSPWLWEYMEEYTRDMARTFHGFRIDNCHSTPLHVAEHLLSQARAIRPELYVCAELFTGSEEKDMLFAARLGLNALIREAMAAWDVAELGRTMCSYGGQPVGCPFQRAEHLPRRFGRVETIMHSTLPALLMDCTHDNETPYERRTALDYLPNAAIVAMSSSAIGSVRGYDELVAKHLDLVTEARLYPPPNLSTGLWAVRRRLNEMHQMILAEGLCEILVRCDQDVMMIERVNPETMASLVLVARTAFGPVHFLHAPEPVVFAGYRVKHRFSAKLTILGDSAEDPAGFIPGIRAEVECSDEEGTAGGETGTRYEIEEGSGGATLRLLEFLPGSILVLAKEPLFQIPRITLQDPAWSAVAERVGSMDLDELNVLLYRCAAEENDGAVPFGVYNLPGYGPLSYSGLQGFYSVLKRLMLNPTPDHPLFENLRAGDWAPRYSSDRLVRDECPRLALLSADIHRLLAEINEMPAWARPRLYIKLLGELYQAAVSAAISRMPRAIVEGSIMVQRLALGSVQLVGRVSSAGLHPSACEPSLSAGLPHFSTHHMRCWGRDVFISLPGLLLKTGRFADCRRHLLAFASCFFRGLIPNLLDSGRRPRFNARDATWWFLHALQAYCREAPGGAEILEAEVALRFGGGEYVDFDDPGIFTQTKRLKEIVQDIMEAHASGIKFREWNAGPELDGVMQDEGFNIEIYTDERTGFIHGGNVHNCGTWMDKMGESTLGGNRGVPATPRDGAAIEITALLFSALEWLEKDCPTGRSTVGLADGTRLSYYDWRGRVQASFERHFYIPERSTSDAEHELDVRLIRYRGIYKDTVGATRAEDDYQLRPNYLVALSIAPQLFEREHGRAAVARGEEYLLGPLGMRTLSCDDPDYEPDYDNQHDSTDRRRAKGFNYHQGPEWVWLFGAYLRAWMHFARDGTDRAGLRRDVLRRLGPHWTMLQGGDFAGLVELTNRNGAYCRDSCATQAWSMATILEVLLAAENGPETCHK